jgi:hypothetical protein
LHILKVGKVSETRNGRVEGLKEEKKPLRTSGAGNSGVVAPVESAGRETEGTAWAADGKKRAIWQRRSNRLWDFMVSWS